MVRGLVWLLIDKKMIEVDELNANRKARKDDPTAGEGPDDGPAN